MIIQDTATMNTLLLKPTDVLFFRDGRPMQGSLSGHGAAWPLPHVVNNALHAALHRAFPDGAGAHAHRPKRNGRLLDPKGVDSARRLFGELVTAGPFPVSASGEWYFPLPADHETEGNTLRLAALPTRPLGPSSLPPPLRDAVVSLLAPSKDRRSGGWISRTAYRDLLAGEPAGSPLFDDAFLDSEAQVGIAIDPATGTTGAGEAAGKIYSAHYLRLREGWALGMVSGKGGGESRVDWTTRLFDGAGHIVIGGQQRVCSVDLATGAPAPLPLGQSVFAESPDGACRVKWILLSPALWPETEGGKTVPVHPGGWLPNWIHPATGKVLLTHGIGRNKAERLRRHGRQIPDPQPIHAHLVASLSGKPLPVTGWSLGLGDAVQNSTGAKSTHLAVPAGAVYYFEADDTGEARKLAAALNWHGDGDGTAILNRRSTLLGEKGFGLGVCGPWEPFGQ